MPIYTSTFTTPEAVNRQLSKADPGAVTVTPAQAEYNDYYALLSDYVVQGSAYVQDMCNRTFVPYRHAYTFEARELSIRQQLRVGTLLLPDDLLSINSVTSDDGAVDASTYALQPNYGVANAIRFYTMPSLGQDDALVVDGMWGYVRDYQRAYTTIETINGTLTLGATTITVADAERYELMQYLRINSELLQISAINTATDVLTVRRGMNGTSASAHTDYTIERFNPEPAVTLATTRLVAFLYQRRNDSAARVQYADGSTIVNEQASIVEDIVRTYRRRLFLRV